jgi:ribosomal subunit interface protein
MDITITARSCTIPDSVRERAEARVDRLHRYEPRMSGGNVIFEEEGLERRVEIRATVDGAPTQVAEGDGESFAAALDKALDRMARRLKKEREKRVDHQAPSSKTLGVEGGAVPG